jgi:(p)ppGpp synthase/HD superfamily hydrolase
MTATPEIEAAGERSPLVRRALSAARDAHAEQVRDDGSGPTPFLRHLLEVAEQLAGAGYPDRVLAAALLHDAVESGGLEVEAVHEQFGDEVARLVEALTERPEIPDHQARKDDLRLRVAAAGKEAQAIYAADKLSNVEALRRGYAAKGEDVDESLKVSLDEKLLVWEKDVEMLRRDSGGGPIAERLADSLAALSSERELRR